MLECSKRVENIINRKVSIFYIETVLNFFFQLRKIFFLRSIEKKSKKNEQSQNFQWKIIWFFIENFDFVHFFYFFFRSISEKIFFGVEKKSWVQFRCKKLRPFDLWCFQRVLSTLTWRYLACDKYLQPFCSLKKNIATCTIDLFAFGWKTIGKK